MWGEKWALPVKFTVKAESRQGKFYVVWYRGANKVLTPVPKYKGEELPALRAALVLAKIKQRHLEDAADGLQRPDPIKPVNRLTIQEAVQKFVTQVELTKDPLTHKVYEQNLREYSEWTKLTYVDQIDKDHLFEYRKHVMDGGNERLTADWKLLRINKMVKKEDFSVVDVCLATNMIQVGLDVPRLSLMAIVGQPKTTAEYIQASSRVGRKEPGAVVTIYNPARPRDRSHYEHFRAYHQSIYRFVEPTSVTPFASPVVERALHAVVIALARMLGGDALSQRPDNPPPSDELVQRLKSIIQDRVSNVDEEQLEGVLDRLNFIVNEWRRVPPSKYGGFAPPDPEEPLMFPSGSERHPRWSTRPLPTPSSMRNVDATCDLGVLSSFPDPD